MAKTLNHLLADAIANERVSLQEHRFEAQRRELQQARERANQAQAEFDRLVGLVRASAPSATTWASARTPD